MKKHADQQNGVPSSARPRSAPNVRRTSALPSQAELRRAAQEIDFDLVSQTSAEKLILNAQLRIASLNEMRKKSNGGLPRLSPARSAPRDAVPVSIEHINSRSSTAPAHTPSQNDSAATQSGLNSQHPDFATKSPSSSKTFRAVSAALASRSDSSLEPNSTQSTAALSVIRYYTSSHHGTAISPAVLLPEVDALTIHGINASATFSKEKLISRCRRAFSRFANGPSEALMLLQPIIYNAMRSFEQVQAPAMVLASAILVRCSEVGAHMQEFQDIFHNTITKIRQLSSVFRSLDGYSSKSRATLFQIQDLFENFSRIQSQCCAEQRHVEDLHAANSAIMIMEAQDSSASFEASAICSSTVHTASEHMRRLLILQQETKAIFGVASASFVSSFQESCSVLDSIAKTSTRSIGAKSMVLLPSSTDEDRVLIQIESFIASSKQFPIDISKFLFIDQCDRLSLESSFSKVIAACSDFSKLYKDHALVVEIHKQVTQLKLSFMELLQNHQFSDSSLLLQEIEQKCCLLPGDTSKNHTFSQCQDMLISTQLQFDKDINTVREQIHLAKMCFAHQRDDSEEIHRHIQAAQTAISNIRCHVPERAALNLLVSKIKSVETRRYWHAKSSVQLTLSSVADKLTKLREDSGMGTVAQENLAKLGATMGSIRGLIAKFCIDDESIINQVHSMQAIIDDLSVLASGAPLEPLELTYSNCIQDFQKLDESDELHQLEYGIPILRQMQYRLKRFCNSSHETSIKESCIEMCERCAQEMSRIELLRVDYRNQSKIQLAAVRELLKTAASQDESDNIPNLHSSIMHVRRVANAIDFQEVLVETHDLFMDISMLVTHRDNWLNSRVLVSLSEVESVFHNNRSEIPDLVAALDSLKKNDILVSKVMNQALQLAITSKIDRTTTILRGSLRYIQNDQSEKLGELESVNSKMQDTIDSVLDVYSDNATFEKLLELQSRGVYLKLKIHIEAADVLQKFHRLSLVVSDFNQRRERLFSLIFEANSISQNIKLWFPQQRPSLIGDWSETDFKQVLLPLHKASRVVIKLRVYKMQNTQDLAERLLSCLFEVLMLAIDNIKEFLANSRQAISMIEKLLAVHDFMPAVPIVDSLKESISSNQITILHLKSCFGTLSKFYQFKCAPLFAATRLLEFDLINVIKHFELSAHDLPMLRAGVLAQGNALLKEAHLACVERKANLARKKLDQSVLLMQKLCGAEHFRLIAGNVATLERRCVAEEAAAKALCRQSRAQGLLHNYNSGLTWLISACEIVSHWNLNPCLVISTYEYIVSSALELLSGICSASNEIWERNELINSKAASCRGQNLIMALMGNVQHRCLLFDVVHKRMLGDEVLIWDEVLQTNKPIKTNNWSSPVLQSLLPPLFVSMTQELINVIETLEVRDNHINSHKFSLLSDLSSSIKANLCDNSLLSAARSRISDAIRERRLGDASSAARQVLISVVTAGVSPDYIMSFYLECTSLSDSLHQLQSSEPAFSVPFDGISLPSVSWFPPKTMKLDIETTTLVVTSIADELDACLRACCCALAETDMDVLESEILSSKNWNNVGFMYAAAALAPRAFFEALLARHSCRLDFFQTRDGLNLLHFASCYCNDQSLQFILENAPELKFAVDCFGRNSLHFIFCANRELVGMPESTIFSIFDSTYTRWMSLQECISKFCPESRGAATLGGFLDFSRHTPRYVRSEHDLRNVLRIFQHNMSQFLEKFSVPDYALNNFMHYIARRSFKGHKASQRKATEARRSGVFGNLALADTTADQEKELSDLRTLHQIFRIIQKSPSLMLVNDENIDGHTPLMVACFHGNSVVVALIILQLGADLTCCDLLKCTPLHLAAECNDHHSFKLLLKCPGIDACAINSRKQSALFRTAASGHESLFIELLAALGAQGATQVLKKVDGKGRRKASVGVVVQQEKPIFHLAKDINNNSLLHAAAFSGNEVICSELLDLGLAPNEMNDLALTPMHIAAIRGHARCLSMLASSLRSSTMCAHPELAASVLQSLLLIPETNTTCHDLKTLILAVSQLSTGGSIDEQAHNGSNFAFASVCANRRDLIEALIELKAKSCVLANGFTTIAHACAFFNRHNILAQLNMKNVDCSSFDGYHRTPLHMCMLKGSVESAIALVQMRQFPVRAKDDFGLTAVNYLTVELLKSAKINRAGLKLDLSKLKALVDTVLAIVPICPEVLLDALPCGISVFHLLATDSSSKIAEIIQSLSSAVGEVIHAMPINPFDARIIPLTTAEMKASALIAHATRINQNTTAPATSNQQSRTNNTLWMQPFLRPGDTPAMVAVRCCNGAALSIIIQFSTNPNRICSNNSPLSQALRPRLQQQQNSCSDLAQILLGHTSGGFSDAHDAKIVAASVARYAGLYKNMLSKPSPLLEKLKSYKALTAVPCLRFKRNAICELFLRQSLDTIQQVVSFLHSGHFVQFHPEQTCDLHGNSILHHIFMKDRNDTHILGLWSLCVSVMESSAKEHLGRLSNNRGKTLLHKCCRFGTVRTLQVVLRAIQGESTIDYTVLFQIPKRSNCSPFSRALKYGNSVLVLFLLSLDTTINTFQQLDEAGLSQIIEALRGPKSVFRRHQTFYNRCICLDSLRRMSPSISLLESHSLQQVVCPKMFLKRAVLSSPHFECEAYNETDFTTVVVQADVIEVSNMFETTPFKESSFPTRIQLPKPVIQCSEHQRKICAAWDKIDELLDVMHTNALVNFDAGALSFNSQKCFMQLAALPTPSNIFVLSIVWSSMSNIISNILCHHESKLLNDIAAFNLTGDFAQRLRFLIELGQDVPRFCRPPSEIIHRSLGMELDAVDAFVASQRSINELAARVCANSALMLQTFSVYVKCLRHAKDFFANSSQFVLERLSVYMNQENPTSASLLSACSKIPPLLHSHVYCCYLMSLVSSTLASIDCSDESLAEFLLESEKMQTLFKSAISSEFTSYASWKCAIPQATQENSWNFVYVDFKSCVVCTNGIDMLNHLVYRSSAANPREMQGSMWEVTSLLESKSPPTGVIEKCLGLIKSEETGVLFTDEDTQRITFLCVTAKQFESMSTTIEKTFSSIATCEQCIKYRSFYEAIEILSSIRKFLQDFDVFERAVASELSQLSSSCESGARKEEDSCHQMLRGATRVLAEAAGLQNTYIHDVEIKEAEIVKRNVEEVLSQCNQIMELFKHDKCIPHHFQPWQKVPTTQERLASSLVSVSKIIDDAQRISNSRELLRICRVFEGKCISFLPAAIVNLSLDPLNLGPLLLEPALTQVENILRQDFKTRQEFVSQVQILENWMSASNALAISVDASSDDVIESVRMFEPLKEVALAHLTHIIDVESFKRCGIVAIRSDCIEMLKIYFQDIESLDAIISHVTHQTYELQSLISCIVDANAHSANLVDHIEFIRLFEGAKASKGLKSRIAALDCVMDMILEREREEAAVKIQRIARGVQTRRLGRMEAASIVTSSKEEARWERQCFVRNAFLTNIVNQILENVLKLVGLHDLKYRYEPSAWQAQHYRRCQAALKQEKEHLSTFFSLCQQLDRAALTYDSLDEANQTAAMLHIAEMRNTYSEEDFCSARSDFFIDVDKVAAKLDAAVRLRVYRSDVSKCQSQLRSAQSRVRHALDSGNHLLALHEASSNWNIDSALSLDKILMQEVELLRGSVVDSISKSSAAKEQLEEHAGVYLQSLQEITFLIEQAQYENAHRYITQAFTNLGAFKALVDRYIDVMVRSEDIPQVDELAVSRLQSVVTIVAERDMAMEQLEANDYCIGGSFDKSYAAINHVHAIMAKSDAQSHAASIGHSLLQMRARVDDAVRLMFRELRRTAAAILMERVNHLNAPLNVMIESRARFLGMIPQALEYSAKVGHISAENVPSDLKIQIEVHHTWWLKVQNQLHNEQRLLDVLFKLGCQHLQELPSALAQNGNVHLSHPEFCCAATAFIQHHLLPMTVSSSDQLPLPSLTSHINLKSIVADLLANIQNYTSEFTANCFTLSKNIKLISHLYITPKQQLDALVAEAAVGNLAQCTVEVFTQISQDFEACEVLVVRTSNSLLDNFPHIQLPLNSEQLRWIKLNAALGSRAAKQCCSFIEKMSVVQDRFSQNSTSGANFLAECHRLLISSLQSNAAPFSELSQGPLSWPDESLVHAKQEEIRTLMDGAALELKNILSTLV